MIALLIAVASAITVSGSGQAMKIIGVPAPYIEIGEIEDALSSDRVIGKITSGLACLPKGKLYWRDIARPTETEIKTEMATAFASFGNSAASGSHENRASVRVDLIIAAVSLKLCVPWMGLGRAPKGGGSITLTWRAVDTGSGKVLEVPSLIEPIVLTGRDPRLDKRVILDAIDRAVADYMGTLQTHSATRAF